MCRNMGGEVIQTTISQSYGQLHFSPSHWQHPNKVELNYKSLHLSVTCLRLQMNHSSYYVVTKCSDTLHTFAYSSSKNHPNVWTLCINVLIS